MTYLVELRLPDDHTVTEWEVVAQERDTGYCTVIRTVGDRVQVPVNLREDTAISIFAYHGIHVLIPTEQMILFAMKW